MARYTRPVSREERLAKNESVFREVNERIAEAAKRTLVLPDAEFLCECGRPDCLERVIVRLDDYEAIRAHPDRFVLVLGQVPALPAEAHALLDLLDRGRERERLVLRRPQQVEREPLRRPRADARQTRQLRDEVLDGG